MEKQDVKQLVDLYNEFTEKMNIIAYIGWGAHADDFHAFKPYHDGIVCLWNYDPNDGVDVSEVPISLLWASNEEIRDYFIEQEYKWKEHKIEIANKNIKEYTKKIEDCNKIIEDCNKIIDGINKIKTELKEISANDELFDLLGNQHIAKTNYEMKIGENQNMIDNINSIIEHNIKRIKERSIL